MRRLKDLMIYSDGGKIWNNLNKTQRRDYIYNSLLKKGYSNIHAAAITGNLQQENGTFGTTRKNLEGSGAIGIAQWLGSRRERLKKDYTDWYDIDKQIEFIDREIKGDRNAWTNNIGGKKGFFNAKDVETATKIFRKDFERPGEHEANDKKRIANAYNVMGIKPSNVNYANNQGVNDGQYQMDPNMKPIDYSQSQFDNHMSQVIGNNMRYDFSTLPNELKQNITDNIKLQEETQKQQTEAQRVEQENLALQKALEQKQQEKEQMLNMIPKATFVETERTNNYINLLNQQASQNYYG